MEWKLSMQCFPYFRKYFETPCIEWMMFQQTNSGILQSYWNFPNRLFNNIQAYILSRLKLLFNFYVSAKFNLTCHNGAPVWMFVSLSKERASPPESRRTFLCRSRHFDEIGNINSVCLVGLSDFKFPFISKKVKIVSEIVV